MKNRLRFYLVIFILVLTLPSPAKVDWINLSGAQSAPNIAEIYVEDDHVRLVLEVYVNDIEKFIDLLPDEWFQRTGMNPPPIQDRMRWFSTDGFQVIIGDEQRLFAEMKLVESRLRKERPNPFAGMLNPYTRQPIPAPPEDKRVLYAEIVYSFKARPMTLTIILPLGQRGIPAASIGSILSIISL